MSNGRPTHYKKSRAREFGTAIAGQIRERREQQQETTAEAKAEFDDGLLIGDVPKNSSGEVIRLRLTEYRGVELADFRLFYDAGAKHRPTGKGFAIRRELLPRLRRLIDKAMLEAGVEDEE